MAISNIDMLILHKEGKDNQQVRSTYNLSNNTFIIDSGATSHMRYSKEGMTNLRPWKFPVKMGNAADMYSEMIGTFQGNVVQQDGRTFNLQLEDVLYIPDLYINLFSMTKALNNNNIDLRKIRHTIIITFNQKNNLLFDREITVGIGRLLGVDIVPNTMDHKTTLLTYNDLHDRLGHATEVTVRTRAKMLKIPISGKATTCEYCAQAKVKKSKFWKEARNKSTKISQRICFDISSVKERSQGGNKFWLLILDEFSNYSWSFFTQQKSDLSKIITNVKICI
jgi:hypothetical protein